MRFNARRSGRLAGTLLAAVAVSILAAGAVRSAVAGATSTITGKVDAADAKLRAETVVYLKSVPGKYPAHHAVVDQKRMTFIPHVTAVAAGDTVQFENHDAIDHNVYSPDNEKFDMGKFPPNESRTYTFKTADVGYQLLCSMHPEMLGYVFVGQNPFHAVVDGAGHYTIDGVPAGTYEIEVWNPKLKAPAQTVTVKAGGSATVNFSLKR